MASKIAVNRAIVHVPTRLVWAFIIFLLCFAGCSERRYGNSDGTAKVVQTPDSSIGRNTQGGVEDGTTEDFMSYWRDFRRVILERDESKYADYVNIPLEIVRENNIVFRVEDRSLLPRIINGFMKYEPVLVITILSHILRVPSETPWLNLDYYNCISRLDTDLKSWNYVFGIETDTARERAIGHEIEEDYASIGGQMEFRRIGGKWKLARLLIMPEDDLSEMLDEEALSRADTVVDPNNDVMTIVVR